MNDLNRTTGSDIEGRPPYFMPPDDFRKTSLEHGDIACAMPMNRDRLVMQRRQLTRGLIETPDLLLRQR